jgi:hypothetical protein
MDLVPRCLENLVCRNQGVVAAGKGKRPGNRRHTRILAPRPAIEVEDKGAAWRRLCRARPEMPAAGRGRREHARK